jgi:hypothetical protein
MISAQAKNEFIKVTNKIEYATANLEKSSDYNKKVELDDGKSGYSDRRNQRKADRAENRAHISMEDIKRDNLYDAICMLELALGLNVI